jgi:hypothetical protein
MAARRDAAGMARPPHADADGDDSTDRADAAMLGLDALSAGFDLAHFGVAPRQLADALDPRRVQAADPETVQALCSAAAARGVDATGDGVDLAAAGIAAVGDGADVAADDAEVAAEGADVVGDGVVVASEASVAVAESLLGVAESASAALELLELLDV